MEIVAIGKNTRLPKFTREDLLPVLNISNILDAQQLVASCNPDNSLGFGNFLGKIGLSDTFLAPQAPNILKFFGVLVKIAQYCES